MKLRLLKLNPDFLIKLIQGKDQSIFSNLPNIVELIDIKYDLFSGNVLVIVRSDDFEDLKDGYPIPEFNLSYSETKNGGIVVTPEPKIKLLKKIKTKIVQDISSYQNEFSSQQRKLLSFKIEDNYLIVKPVKYLKKEWNEINEVVKNIGGEWIKGSIISYWKIPI
jgi:hypothetical protein